MNEEIEVILGGAPKSSLPFSPAVAVGGLLFVSGQASVSASGEILAGSFEEEMRRSLENLRQVLGAAGCGLEHVVQTRNYVRDPSDLKQFNAIYRDYFNPPYPARTTLTHCLPDTLKFEIDAIAVRSAVRPAVAENVGS